MFNVFVNRTKTNCTGTTTQVLNAHKPLIVVVNETLHDNHQLELAHQLAQDHHLVYCTPSTLGNTLRTFDKSELRLWQPGQPQRFARCSYRRPLFLLAYFADG